jgi:hypothetical protein
MTHALGLDLGELMDADLRKKYRKYIRLVTLSENMLVKTDC